MKRVTVRDEPGAAQAQEVQEPAGARALAGPGTMPLGLILAVRYCERHAAEVVGLEAQGKPLDRTFFVSIASCEKCEVRPYGEVAFREVVAALAFGPMDSKEFQAATGALALRILTEVFKRLK